MNLLRCTVIDHRGGVSFLAHADALPALVNACGFYPQTLEDFLDLTAPFYASLREYVMDGLAIFDEHNLAGNWEPIHAAIIEAPIDAVRLVVIERLIAVEQRRREKRAAVLVGADDVELVRIAIHPLACIEKCFEASADFSDLRFRGERAHLHVFD